MHIVTPGSATSLSEHDRMILDLEADQPNDRLRQALCEQIDLPASRYQAVAKGLADTEAAYAYAPEVVMRLRRSRDERFAFERRNRRWMNLSI